jgi:hypothetical protein
MEVFVTEKILRIKKETERFILEMVLVRMGRDLCVSLSGGDTPHIGAVALAVPHAGLSDPLKTDASVSLSTVTGHKEDELARKIAYRLAVKFNCTVSASCGIHIDNARKEEIFSILNAADAITDEAIILLNS